MKTDLGNFRVSWIQGIMKRIKAKDIGVVVFELVLKEETFFNSKVIRDFKELKKSQMLEYLIDYHKNYSMYKIRFILGIYLIGTNLYKVIYCKETRNMGFYNGESIKYNCECCGKLLPNVYDNRVVFKLQDNSKVILDTEYTNVENVAIEDVLKDDNKICFTIKYTCKKCEKIHSAIKCITEKNKKTSIYEV